MAAITKRGNTFQISVSMGYDTDGKKIRKTTTFKPPANTTEKKAEKLAKEFVCVQIDMNEEKNGAICDAYNVAVSPTVQFVTAQGAPLQRLASVQSGERLAAQMQIALTSVAWRDARGEEEKALLR